MVATSLILASEVIGFISFFLTILTWIGVYISLLTSLRMAPRTIPVTLGNLREEILSERSLMKYRLKRGDQYHVFPGRETHKVGNQQSHSKYAQETLKVLWRRFKAIERKFVIKENGDVETASSQDDVNGGSENGWVDEKRPNSRSKRARHFSRRNSYIRSRMGVTEAGLSVDKKTYYNTDLWHRVLWWWEQSDITNLYDRVEKLQIRRMEYDMWETDELVKRTLRIVGGMSGDDIWYSDNRGPKRGGPRGSGRNGGGNGNGGGGAGGSISSIGSRRSSGGYRKRNNQKRSSSINMNTRSRNASVVSGGVRSVYEKEVIHVKERDEGDDSTPTRGQPSVTASRRDRRSSRAAAPSVVEYEVVRPGRIWVETVDDRDGPDRGSMYNDRYQQRHSSYSRERSPSRGRR